MSKDRYRLGMIGLGTVGSGVLELLRRRRDALSGRLDRPLEIARIAVRDLARPRPVLESHGQLRDRLTSRPEDIIADSSIELLVEVAGGIEDARKWIIAAIDGGKDVVTANKAVLAVHGEEIFRHALAKGQRVYYEASVAAALPIIEMLQNGLIANQVTRLAAILNGTCNFILSQMDESGMAYDVALELAQKKGFAEADPTLDVSGGDAAHKLALLAGIVTGSYVPIDSVYTEGIERIAADDFEFARHFKHTIKLLGILRLHEGRGWEMRVHPALIPADSALARVRDEFNAAEIDGDAVGPMVISGKGAGALPTASSIVADIMRAARGERASGNPHGLEPPKLIPMEDVETRHYLRLVVMDQPGILARLTSFFGNRGISIASVEQPQAQTGKSVPIILTTHCSRDQEITEVLGEIEAAGLVEQPVSRIRIEGDS